MAIALVQSVKVVASTVSTTTCVYGTNVTAGNLLCVAHSQYEGTGVSTIVTPTDTLTHTYAPMTAEQVTSSNTVRIRSFYVENCSGGANTVTFDMSGALVGDITGVIAEFSGAATASALDATQVGAGTGTAVDSGATATTAQADEMVWGGMVHNEFDTTIAETGSASLVQENEGGTTTAPIGVSYRIVAAAAAYSATWTIGASAAWIAHVATFKALVAGGGGSAPRGSSMLLYGVG